MNIEDFINLGGGVSAPSGEADIPIPAAVDLSGYMPKSGGAFTNGISFGSNSATGPTVVTRHIALWGTAFGFSITTSTLNYVSSANHDFYAGSSRILSVSPTTFTYAGKNIWYEGNFDPSSYQPKLGYTPVNKAGDTITGVVEVSMTTPQVKLTSTNTAKTRYLYHDGTNIGFLNSTGGWAFRTDDTGALWCSQLGDINGRIENRASAYAANCVTSSQMAGYIEQQASTGGTYTYSAYVITMASRRDSDAYAFGFRQPQLYIPSRGWFAAFPF
ncbi:hypothetical protein [Rhizobium sp. BK376]|uniref:hypothetical protein n=1 Tax=Rhizobium sp. BK376 TaxID=2512149 RepID=UPI001051FB96|nr:hypothetical protein [Rhizobium sp. BK376]TCR92572.1 hypothetical protein EV561_1015 [Rhizobium sp. BK376]